MPNIKEMYSSIPTTIRPKVAKKINEKIKNTHYIGSVFEL